MESEKWRPSSRREQQDDDKFRDFRTDPKPGYQRYNANDKFGGNNNRGYNRGNNRYHDNHSEEEEPEWMTEGADTMYDVLNLDDCRLPEHAKAHESISPDRGGSASPELVAFDMGNFGKSTGGGLEDELGGGLEDELGGLEDNASPRHPGEGGLQDFNSKELDDLLDQVDIADEDLLEDPFKQDSDEDTRGESRFISFINKQEPNPNPTRLSNIWDRAPPSLQQMAPPQIPNVQHRPPPVADPSILEMRGIPGKTNVYIIKVSKTFFRVSTISRCSTTTRWTTWSKSKYASSNACSTTATTNGTSTWWCNGRSSTAIWTTPWSSNHKFRRA